MIFIDVSLLSVSTVITVYAFRLNPNYINRLVLTLFTVNFLLGHIFLLAFRLITQATNPILLGDQRLIGSSVNISYLIFLNLLEYVCTGFGYCLLQKYGKRKPTTMLDLPISINRALIGMASIGWIGNIAGLIGRNNLFSAFHPFEIMGTVWLVSGFRLKELKIFYPILFGVSHLVWAIFFFHSKSEAFVILVGLIIRVVYTNPKKIKLKISVIIIATGILFPFIQTKKGIETASAAHNILTQNGTGYSSTRSFIIGILQRFDGADSITDAYFAGSGAWYDIYDYIKLLLGKFIPNVSFLVGNYFGENSEKSSSMGQLWNDQMRPLSIVNVTPGVPVTYGPLAEGYAISGIALGIGLSILFGAIISRFCDLSYSKNLLGISCGVYFICHLETLQNSTGTLLLLLPKALQCFLFLSLLRILLSAVSPKRE